MRDTCIIALSTTTIRTTNRDGIAVVEVTGEVDVVSGGSLLAVLTAQLDQRPTGLVVDLTGTEFFGSTGIGTLLRISARAQDRGVVLVVVAGHRTVLRPLRITGVDRELRIQPTVALALAALGARPAPSSSRRGASTRPTQQERPQCPAPDNGRPANPAHTLPEHSPALWDRPRVSDTAG